MTNVLLRRRKLGLTSCKEIARLAQSDFTVLRNDKPFPNNVTTVFRWGCTSDVPDSVKVVNKAKAIHLVNDKTGFRKLLNEKNLCPSTFFSVKEALENRGFPFVVRPSKHAQGRHLYVANTERELIEAVARCGPSYYISKLIDKVAEYRVFVANGRAVWVAKKTPGNPEDVAWNVARGGRFDNVRWDDWPLKAVKKSVEAFELSGLDFGGVDVMVDKNNNVFVLEINSAPSQTSPYRQQCVAKVFDYIVENGTKTIPLIGKPGGYLKFIHPAVEPRAKIGEVKND